MKRHSRTMWLSAGITVAVFGLAVALVTLPGPKPSADQALAQQAQASARTWSMFGGQVSRNMVNLVEKNPPDDWAIEKKDLKGKITQPARNIKWVVPLGSKSYGGPTIAAGKIFIGTNNGAPRNPKIKGDKGIIMCFNEADGKFLWQAVHDKLPAGMVQDWPHEGICSAPVVEGNRAYYVSNRCDVVCVDVDGDGAGNAKFLWKYDMIKEQNVFPHNLAACSPVIVGDLIFVVTANGVNEDHITIPSPNAPSFLALNKKDGTLAWKDSSPGKFIMHGQWSNPTYALVNGKPQIIFPGGDGYLYGFELTTGKQLWKFDGNPKHYKYELGGRISKNDYISTPVVWENKLYVGLGQDPEHFEGVGHFWCIDLTKAEGDCSPDLVVDAKVDPPKTMKNPKSAAVWHFGGSYSKEEAAKVGRDYPFSRTMTTVAVHEGLLYVADLPGYFYCLDALTGKHLWQHDLKAGVWGSPYWVDGKVYIGSEDGDVWIFQHGAAKKEPKRLEIGRTIQSTPVVVNGVLYVMTQSHLFAIAPGK